jgi:molybdenum cofactor biosynthesis protein B
MTSFQSVGLSTMQSRACAGLAKGTLIFALPGSNGACKDGWDKLIRWQLDARHRPCNLAELIPRFTEV